jgi:hypothetical protein
VQVVGSSNLLTQTFDKRFLEKSISRFFIYHLQLLDFRRSGAYPGSAQLLNRVTTKSSSSPAAALKNKRATKNGRVTTHKE